MDKKGEVDAQEIAIAVGLWIVLLVFILGILVLEKQKFPGGLIVFIPTAIVGFFVSWGIVHFYNNQ